mmetsp:Transcript_2537/g.9801  ORF Transcript_2537/g.9801 Transcript_2537/m.9801 type:complete len:235 (+) Transcript_2537:3772-4476(+)
MRSSSLFVSSLCAKKRASVASFGAAVCANDGSSSVSATRSKLSAEDAVCFRKPPSRHALFAVAIPTTASPTSNPSTPEGSSERTSLAYPRFRNAARNARAVLAIFNSRAAASSAEGSSRSSFSPPVGTSMSFDTASAVSAVSTSLNIAAHPKSGGVSSPSRACTTYTPRNGDCESSTWSRDRFSSTDDPTSSPSKSNNRSSSVTTWRVGNTLSSVCALDLATAHAQSASSNSAS